MKAELETYIYDRGMKAEPAGHGAPAEGTSQKRVKMVWPMHHGLGRNGVTLAPCDEIWLDGSGHNDLAPWGEKWPTGQNGVTLAPWSGLGSKWCDLAPSMKRWSGGQSGVTHAPSGVLKNGVTLAPWVGSKRCDPCTMGLRTPASGRVSAGIRPGEKSSERME